MPVPGCRPRVMGWSALVIVLSALAALSAACARPPSVSFEVAVAGGEPASLAVTMELRGVPRDGLVLRGFADAAVLGIERLEAQGPDGAAIEATRSVETVPINKRAVDIPRVTLRGPLPATLVVRYAVTPGKREGDAHMGFTGRCHGYLGADFGFVLGRNLFLLPADAEALRDITVRFALPEGWAAATPWARDGDRFRAGLDGRYAGEHLIAAAVGLGRFRERSLDAGGTTVRLAFEAGIPPAQEEETAARLRTVVESVRRLFGRAAGSEYVAVVMPKAPTGDDIAVEGWATGQGGTLAPATGSRLTAFAENLIEVYTRFAPYRTEIGRTWKFWTVRSDEFWLVDGIKGLYAPRAVAAAGLIPADAVMTGMAEAYLTSLGVTGVEDNLEALYATPGSKKIEREVRAPFVLAHVDHEVREATGGRESLDDIVPKLFAGRRAPSLWSLLPARREGSWDEFRARYVRGAEMVPVGQFYAMAPMAPKPEPPAGPPVKRLVVHYTGETHGYLENCGCKVNQAGGVARRATTLKALAKTDPGALLLDAGSAFVMPEKQNSLDFLTMQEQSLYLKTMDLMRYQAAAVGLSELTFGLEYFRRQTQGLALPYIVANVKADGRQIAPGVVRLVTGGVRVAVIGIFEPPWGKNAGRVYEDHSGTLAIEDPIEVLKREVPGLKRDADLVIALGRISPQTIRQLAGQVPQLDMVISGDYRAPAEVAGADGHVHAEDESGFVGRLLVAYTHLTNYGFSSVSIGLDGDGRVASAEFTDRWLYDDTPDDPVVRELLNDFYDRVGREAAARESVPPLFADDPARLNGVYVGALKCAECHAEQMAQWRRTAHGAAYKTLLDRHRHFQPKCISCHVVGYGTPHGYKLGSPEASLANVQCEVCHGPGADHAGEPTAQNIRKAVPEKVCLECHTPDHSDHFVYAERLPKVKHDYYD